MNEYLLGFMSGVGVSALVQVGVLVVYWVRRPAQSPRSYYESLVEDAETMRQAARQFLEESKALQAELQRTLRLPQHDLGNFNG